MPRLTLFRTASVADLARSQGIPMVSEGSQTPSPSIPPPLLWFDTDEDEGGGKKRRSWEVGKLESWEVGKLDSWEVWKLWSLEVVKLQVGKLGCSEVVKFRSWKLGSSRSWVRLMLRSVTWCQNWTLMKIRGGVQKELNVECWKA